MRADSWPEGGVPGSDYGLLRVQLLDEHDIDFGILLCLNAHDAGYEHPDLDAAINRVVNEWIVEEWLERDERLRSCISVPYDHPELAVAEIERWAGDERFVQVLLPASGQEPFGSRKYWPVYRAAAEAGLPVAFHTGGYTGHRGAGWPSFYLEEHVWNGNTMASLIMSLLCEGVFERIPSLQVACIEGGIAWAGPLMWSLDDAWTQLRADVPHLRRPPSEYIREHFWFTTQPIEEPEDPRHLETALDHIGMPDRIMFASDYPHWDFDSPRLAPRLFPSAARERIMGLNACRLYDLPERVRAR
jgi:predicted TIM-barrel fold metal-dependent hydrolase